MLCEDMEALVRIFVTDDTIITETVAGDGAERTQLFDFAGQELFLEESLKHAKELGYKTVFWSFGYADWDNNNQMSPERAKQKIIENIHNGEIMLLHPTSATNAQILGDVIREIKSKGYRFGTLNELGGEIQ